MAVAAKKEEYIYAPSRVYSHSRAATAEALPQAEPMEAPLPQEEPIPAQRRRQPQVKTRVHRGVSPRQRRKQRLAPKVASVVGIFVIAAILIGVIVRYSAIALAYSNVNDLKNKIAESQRNIAALDVQLNNALNLGNARSAAEAAGLSYPTAGQIVSVHETIGSYQKNDSIPEDTADADDTANADDAVNADDAGDTGMEGEPVQD